jgi:hypothetical protein
LRKASVSFVGIAYYVSKRNAAKPKIASPHANKISSFTKISRLTSGSNSRAFVLTYHYRRKYSRQAFFDFVGIVYHLNKSDTANGNVSP